MGENPLGPDWPRLAEVDGLTLVIVIVIGLVSLEPRLFVVIWDGVLPRCILFFVLVQRVEILFCEAGKIVMLFAFHRHAPF
jgi:hypothetical protein